MVEVNKHLTQVAYHHWHCQCPRRRDRTVGSYYHSR